MCFYSPASKGLLCAERMTKKKVFSYDEDDSIYVMTWIFSVALHCRMLFYEDNDDDDDDDIMKIMILSLSS